jgi:Flp pilus assembly protein CpaB
MELEATTTVEPDPGPGGPGPTPASSRRRLAGARPRHSGRALAGGLLVAVAMLVTFAAATHHDQGPGQSVVVARHRVPLGTRLAATDLATERVQVPDAVAAGAFGSSDQVAGQVTLGPLDAGDVVERAAVATPAAAPALQVLSFPIDRERALDGALQAGQSVDLLATYGTGASAQTVVVARDVRLIDVVDDSRQSLASAGRLVVTVGLASASDALAATHASQVGALTLVSRDRAAAGGGADRGPDTYSLPAAGTDGATLPAG